MDIVSYSIPRTHILWLFLTPKKFSFFSKSFWYLESNHAIKSFTCLVVLSIRLPVLTIVLLNVSISLAKSGLASNKNGGGRIYLLSGISNEVSVINVVKRYDEWKTSKLVEEFLKISSFKSKNLNGKIVLNVNNLIKTNLLDSSKIISGSSFTAALDKALAASIES